MAKAVKGRAGVGLTFIKFDLPLSYLRQAKQGSSVNPRSANTSSGKLGVFREQDEAQI